MPMARSRARASSMRASLTARCTGCRSACVPLFTMPITYVFDAGLDLPVPNDESPEFWRARWK
jgi:hypothetical protein